MNTLFDFAEEDSQVVEITITDEVGALNRALKAFSVS